ncbi:hypothetical protein JW964_00735 [candidate division KSB1 bacterium]|nr:hypothetical protein [candidate division KSB1 bacterium]
MIFEKLFTPPEWQVIISVPVWIFQAVAGADQEIDKKELKAFLKELQEADYYKEPLVREILASITTNFPFALESQTRDAEQILQDLERVHKVLHRRVTPEQADNFKKDMLLIAQQIAQASSSGLFGLRARISPEEETVIDDIIKALHIE